jgi:hypothetical protein
MTSRLTVALDAMPLGNDYRWPADYSAQIVAQALLRPLFAVADNADNADDDGNGVRPGAARAATAFDDGRRWRVHLDDTLRWSDGRPLTAHDCVAAADGVLRRPRTSAGRWLRDGAVHPAVRAVDEHTVEYRFARPIGFAPALLTLPQFAPARPRTPAATLGSHRLESRSERHLLLRRTPATRGRGADTILFRCIDTMSEALAAYAADEIDITPTTSMSPTELDALSGHPDLVSRDIDIFGSLEFGALAGGLSAGPSGGPSVPAVHRRCVAALIDRERLVHRLGGLARPWSSPLDAWERPPAESQWGRPSAAEMSALAAALPAHLTIAYARFAPNDEVVGEICAQLGDALGRPCTPVPLSFDDYVRAIISGQHALLYTLTTADFPHPAALLSPWHSAGGAAARAGHADPVLDALIEAAEAADGDGDGRDGGAAGPLWRAAADRWRELPPRVPLLRVRSHFLRKPQLDWLRVNRSGLLDFGIIHHMSAIGA